MYEYKLIRSNRKTITLHITVDCEIIVRAPNSCSRQKIDKYVSEATDWIEKTLVKQRKKLENKVTLDEETVKKLKKLAGEVLPKKTELFAEKMGVEYGTVKITSAQKRFGSCNAENNICYSYILMLYPEEAIDYVVVHELAHTVYHNHGSQFYSFIESVMPDYKQRDKLLKGVQRIPDSLFDN